MCQLIWLNYLRIVQSFKCNMKSRIHVQHKSVREGVFSFQEKQLAVWRQRKITYISCIYRPGPENISTQFFAESPALKDPWLPDCKNNEEGWCWNGHRTFTTLNSSVTYLQFLMSPRQYSCITLVALQSEVSVVACTAHFEFRTGYSLEGAFPL